MINKVTYGRGKRKPDAWLPGCHAELALRREGRDSFLGVEKRLCSETGICFVSKQMLVRLNCLYKAHLRLFNAALMSRLHFVFILPRPGQYKDTWHALMLRLEDLGTRFMGRDVRGWWARQL